MTNSDTARQQVLFLWLASSALDSHTLGWSFYDGADGGSPLPDIDPPYSSAVEALRDGWRLLQVSELRPPAPGAERETSFLKHECMFERFVG